MLTKTSWALCFIPAIVLAFRSASGSECSYHHGAHASVRHYQQGRYDWTVAFNVDDVCPNDDKAEQVMIAWEAQISDKSGGSRKILGHTIGHISPEKAHSTVITEEHMNLVLASGETVSGVYVTEVTLPYGKRD